MDRKTQKDTQRHRGQEKHRSELREDRGVVAQAWPRRGIPVSLGHPRLRGGTRTKENKT